MSVTFRQRIRAALANPVLQAALDANAERRQQAFKAAFESLPQERELLRKRAHAVRAETIAHLDSYLEQFIANVQANGIAVHRAADAKQAVQIVLDLVQRAGARTVAKSKSMVSEEIHLNQALEAAGIRPVETDLGEYIVQLRGEPPAHIITPAVHLRRGEVGRTFAEKLGVAYTEDVAVLTRLARQVLRQTFLEAEVGLSGVNFGVAESGTLCLVTNEGNGRMVTTLPPRHIALMGIERLVPTLEDLALMLYLLPRSATGQKLSVYTSLIHGPRRPGEVDGPQERHLILLDNGRSALRASPLAEALYCIRCGACLNACPVFREIGGHAYQGAHGAYSPYPGPIGSVVSPGLFGVAEFGHLARASSLCGACREVCPVDIDLPKLLLRVRAAGAGCAPQWTAAGNWGATLSDSSSLVPKGLRWGLHLFAWVAASPWRYALAQRLLGGVGWLMSPFSRWVRLPSFSGWGYSKDFPLPHGRPFRDRFRNLAAVTPVRREIPAEITPMGERVPSSAPRPLSEWFLEELSALGGVGVRCSAAELKARLLHDLAARQIDRVQAWEEAHLPQGLLAWLRQNGVQVHLTPDPDLPAGLSGALAAVAESGTLVLTSGPGRPLTASLLPPLHFVILHERDILARLPEALRLPALRQAAAAVLISGPSRTADIEMTLTIGVHGPAELIVYLLSEGE